MRVCGYGCGRQAKYPPKKGMPKWCCEEDYRKCPEVKRKNSRSSRGQICYWKGKKRPEIKTKLSKAMKESHNRAEVKEKLSKLHTLTIKQIQKRYKTFSKEEEMRYNSNREIQVHCKHSKCEKSKENGGWFTPTKNQFFSRIYALEKEDGNDGSYIYCSEECKQKCCLFNFRSDPNILKEFEKYRKDVDKETDQNAKAFYNEIKNIELRGYKYSYDLDHKYTVYDGFINNINPKIIGHWKNLECIPSLKNVEKGKKSSIKLEELLKEVTLYDKKPK